MTVLNAAHELRLDAKAFRENTVYDSDGDAIRLIANAERMEAGAAAIDALEAERDALQARVDALVEALDDCHEAISQLPEDALGFAEQMTDPGTGEGFVYPLRDELLAKATAALSQGERS